MDAVKWLLVECMLHEDEKVTYRMTELKRNINYRYNTNWQDDVKSIFERLVWLWSGIVEEIPARDRYARKASSPPSVRKTILRTIAASNISATHSPSCFNH
jgi:hypothetical protein